ncbi:MAG: hypothetical protein N2255_08555, partial [Kiritimatiellae bacterium]|nr:hypothetical protein [Kiritimatiellia bacterium]
MTRLAILSVSIGAVLTTIGVVCASVPGHARKWIAAFPRSRWAAGILAAIALFWSGILVNEMSFGRFEQLKPLLWVVGPV